MTLRGFFRRSLAGVLSLLMAGLGQTFNRQPRKGVIFLILVPTVVLLAGGIRLLSTFPGLVIAVSLQLLLLLWAIADAAFYGGCGAKERTGFFVAQTWYVCAILLIILNGIGEGKNFYQSYLRSGMETRVDPSDSMDPTIRSGDRFVVDMRDYEHRSPQRGEVVLFEHDVQGHGTEDYVKRIIAIGGDTIEGTKDGIFLNGKLLNERYAKHESPQEATDTKRVFGPTTVLPEQFFVMGDNRDDSYDSRYFGTVPRSRIEGRLLFLYWSHDKSRIGRSIH